MTTTALLVSHDGARWLPAVLDGLLEQTLPPDRVVAVDTGSVDATMELLATRLGRDAVLSAPATSGFGDAVATGLAQLPPAEPGDWVWLLHDDSRPAPDALARLTEAAATHPSADLLGPKLREWPSLRRLLEVGVTISGTGRRETGLERGEYDQGQHDGVHDVLAVNSAGLLVRREVLERLGFDPHLPMFANDLDLGWRAARAGHRTITVPEAVVFHVEAAHRGVRRTPVTTDSHRRAERAAALYVLLANGSALGLPFQVLRLLVGSLVRAVGLLLVRAPREAYDELVALAATYARPHRIVAARLRRRRTATVPARAVRHLLAPAWLPYRHGLDFVSDIAIAVARQAGDASGRRAATRVEAETGPVSADAQNLPVDTGLVARLLRSPTAAVFLLLVVLALLGLRGVVGSGLLAGGALLPAPDSAMTWWRLYLESWHDVGVGSGAAASPALVPLALAGTLLLGKAWLVVDLVMLFSVPLGAWGAYRFLRTLTRSMPPALWGAVAYGLLPVLTGAVDQGRLGTVAAALVLPWLAHAALFLRPGHAPDRRWRAAWRTALLLAVLTAFVPPAWGLALVLALGVLAAALFGARQGRASPTAWAPVLVAVGFVPVLLLPWSLLGVVAPAGAGPLAALGLPAESLLSPVGVLDVLLGRPADVGSAPGWFSVPVLLAAVLGLLRRDVRAPVTGAWLVLLAAVAAGVLLARQPAWAGFPLLLAQAAAITAAAAAGSGVSGQLAGRSFGWRQPVGVVVVVAALLSPALGLVWWVAEGVTGPMDRRVPTTVPAYMADAARADADSGVLVVRSGPAQRLEYVVFRGDGQRLGDETVASTAADQSSLTSVVERLASAPEAEDVELLSRHGIGFVYAEAPVDVTFAGNLDSVSGLSSASAVRPATRAWQLEADPSDEALAVPPSGTSRALLLGGQGAAVLVGLVLAAPTRRVRR